MKNIRIFLIIFIVATISSCGGDDNKLGEVHYYPKFLWKDASLTPVEKTFDFDFSEDARNDPNSFAEFQFMDNNGHPMSTDVMQVLADDEPLPNNILHVKSDVSSKKVSFTFTPSAEMRTYQGTLKLIRHNLDRIDAQTLTPGQQVDVLTWSIQYNKSMNPLAKGLMWLGIFIAAVLILWFTILKRMFFPLFKGVHQMSVVEPYYSTKSFKNRRKIVLCATPPAKPQSLINKLFTGEICYEANPIWITPLEITPSKKAARITNKPGYLILSADGMSLPNKWIPGGVYTIEHLEAKTKATIKVI